MSGSHRQHRDNPNYKSKMQIMNTKLKPIAKDTDYWTVELFAGNFEVESSMWFGDKIDMGRFSNNLYFETQDEARKMCNKLRRVLLGEESGEEHDSTPSEGDELPPEVINEHLTRD